MKIKYTTFDGEEKEVECDSFNFYEDTQEDGSKNPSLWVYQIDDRNGVRYVRYNDVNSVYIEQI